VAEYTVEDQVLAAGISPYLLDTSEETLRDVAALLSQAREQGRREARAETASVLRKLADGLSQAADALRILAPDDTEDGV
jgi:acyl-CoA reductase-like NAD-dependent aldehyde dehydrogenase